MQKLQGRISGLAIPQYIIASKEGGKIPIPYRDIKFLDGKIEAINQDHEKATYIDKISKEEAFIDLKESPEKNYRKIQALQKIKPYFFTKKNGQKIRLIIKKAQLEDGNLEILRVVPEGKKEMDYKDFLRGNN